MINEQVLDAIPLWAVFVLTVAVISLALEVGFRQGRKEHESSGGDRKGHTGTVVAASLGLLAFMLAFTFGAVASRFDEKKRLVLDEANAVGTTYLRAELLTEPRRRKVRQLLSDYVAVRIEAAQKRSVDVLIPESKRIQDELWSMAVTIGKDDPNSEINALFIESLNDVIDLHQKRLTVAVRQRMPTIFWLALYSLSILAMFVAGYDAGLAGRRRSITSLALILAFSVVVLLVVALDRPRQGLVTVNQGALIDLHGSMKGSI